MLQFDHVRVTCKKVEIDCETVEEATVCYSSNGLSGKGWERKEKRDVWPGIKHGARVHKRTDNKGGGHT